MMEKRNNKKANIHDTHTVHSSNHWGAQRIHSTVSLGRSYIPLLRVELAWVWNYFTFSIWNIKLYITTETKVLQIISIQDP